MRAPGGKQATAGYCTWLGAQPTVHRSDLGTEGDPSTAPHYAYIETSLKEGVQILKRSVNAPSCV